MNNFELVDFNSFSCNPFSKIGDEWMLITAGDENKVNTMTASWGGLGVMWGKNASFIFIRPQRYTKEFVDNNETFSLCFFKDNFKKTLSYLGAVSGRDEEKIEKSGLTTRFLDGTPYFEEADLVLFCKKMYHQDLEANCFIDSSSLKWYENNDYHTMYVSEIEKIFCRKI